MDTSGTIDQGEEDILTDPVPDEVLEAAASVAEGRRFVSKNFSIFCC